MKYCKEVKQNINFINAVLDSINVPDLLNNSEFVINEMSNEFWFKASLKSDGENRVPFRIICSTSGIEIGLDRVNEVLDYSNESLNKYKEAAFSVIQNLFTSHILVEYVGNARTYIRLFEKNGNCTNTFKLFTGFSITRKRISHLYSPAFDPHEGIQNSISR